MIRSFSAFLRLLTLTVFRSNGTFARFTPRRLLVMSIFLPLLFSAQLFHWIGFLIDAIFFRGYRKVTIKDPVFILGIPRSGTTLLHRVVAQDTDRFTSFKLWEILFAPSIAERRLWLALNRFDHALGGYCRRALVAVDGSLFRRFDKIHEMSLFDYDEDDMVLTAIFASAYLYFPFPFRETMWRLARFDEETSQAEKDRIMSFYKSCIQRHLYCHGPEKQFLSKNPAFSPKIDALRSHFPDARVVCNIRSPYETIPSSLSLLYAAFDMFDNESESEEFHRIVLDIAGHWYRHPMSRLEEWPENQFAFLAYDDLKEDLEGTLQGLYKRFGFEIGSIFAERLHLEHVRARAYKSKHRYSLEQYGVSPEDILEEFGDIFERYGFDTEYPAIAEAQKLGA